MLAGTVVGSDCFFLEYDWVQEMYLGKRDFFRELLKGFGSHVFEWFVQMHFTPDPRKLDWPNLCAATLVWVKYVTG
jgi:hypothetical protein